MEYITKVFVTKLPPQTRPAELRRLFEDFGGVLQCDVNNKFGFIHMENPEVAHNAILGLNGIEFKGYKIVVELGRERTVTNYNISGGGDSNRGRPILGATRNAALPQCSNSSSQFGQEQHRSGFDNAYHGLQSRGRRPGNYSDSWRARGGMKYSYTNERHSNLSELRDRSNNRSLVNNFSPPPSPPPFYDPAPSTPTPTPTQTPPPPPPTFSNDDCQNRNSYFKRMENNDEKSFHGLPRKRGSGRFQRNIGDSNWRRGGSNIHRRNFGNSGDNKNSSFNRDTNWSRGYGGERDDREFDSNTNYNRATYQTEDGEHFQMISNRPQRDDSRPSQQSFDGPQTNQMADRYNRQYDRRGSNRRGFNNYSRIRGGSHPYRNNRGDGAVGRGRASVGGRHKNDANNLQSVDCASGGRNLDTNRQYLEEFPPLGSRAPSNR